MYFLMAPAVLYSGTESVVKCGAGISSFFAVNTGVRQGCVLDPSLFNTCIDWVLGKVVDQSDCGASLGNTKISGLVFADDAVIFAESLEVLVMALKALHEEAKPLGFEVSWLKTKVQVLMSPGPTAIEGTHSTRLSNKMGKVLESWCSEKQRNKLLEQAMFPALSHAAWVDVFVKYNTAIPSSAAVERLFSPRGRAS
ncbi:Retrovirus-related Pol polyprotein from type-1 retrotransposable element R2 [Chionoecetes opilio]|uniref:Retrovirus-related Pol polyprotein from type-1 retrotransposable element R2 n=1 Tax=Chionoecetes opilio TaxID=41210 RepID=A0A8J5BYF6_CHIOP|nr:Retrovirus-related Pol polyprotein from type-1 retrotransposable element R2 [Chionoecetes opilio]